MLNKSMFMNKFTLTLKRLHKHIIMWRGFRSSYSRAFPHAFTSKSLSDRFAGGGLMAIDIELTIMCKYVLLFIYGPWVTVGGSNSLSQLN